MHDVAATALAIEPREQAPEPFLLQLAPELILPAQFHAGWRCDAASCPEKRLMLAVLEGAVDDFQRCVTAHDRAGQRRFHEAEGWFESSDTDWPYSFQNICQALGLDAGYLRAGLRRLRDLQRTLAPGSRNVIRVQRRRVAGIRSKATGRALLGRTRARG